MSEDLGPPAQRAAEAHLAACWEAYWAEEEGREIESPACAPFCGCDTCVVREVLFAAWSFLESAVANQDKDGKCSQCSDRQQVPGWIHPDAEEDPGDGQDDQ